MGAPTAAFLFANSRSGRRIVAGTLTTLALLIGAGLAPLVLIPVAVASAPATQEDSLMSDPVTGEWATPMSGTYFKGRGFGWNPVSGCAFCSKDHQGYDMSQGCGSTIFAAGPGTVLTSGAYQGYGNTVRIDHGNGLISLYGHMEWGSLAVSEGDPVSAGAALGTEGNTGRSFGCHLHFELQQDGVAIDPAPFMAARGIPLQ